MKKKTIILTSLSVAVVLAIVAGSVLYRAYYDRRVPNFSKGAELFVYPETSVEDVISMLSEQCGPKNTKSMLRSFKNVHSVKPGHYTVSASNPSLYVARMLSAGWQTPVNLVLSGTMRSNSVIARKISNQMLIDSVSVVRALEDEALLAEYGFDRKNVFSMIIPDTYQVWWTDDMKAILDKQKAAYEAFWTEENKAKAKSMGLSPKDASILASIVNGETNHKPEMPKVAGVYLNRLAIGMLLQADPTVAYCFDYSLTRVLRKHLEVDSPYNTYKYKGLPPGPICVPSKDCLEAVLNPDFGNGSKTAGAAGGNIYFCANADFSGTHAFARTLSEHNANARAFQAELNRRAAAKRSGK